MRYKHFFGVLMSLAALAIASWAAPSGPQLTAVNVTPNGNTVVVTLRAAGPIEHTEYRPEDQILMVDLHGVSPGGLKVKEKTVDLPALKSYRVLSYIGANGTENTRVELTLGENVSFKVEPTVAALEVRLTVKTPAAQASAPAANPPAASAPAAPAAPVTGTGTQPPAAISAKAPTPAAKTPATPALTPKPSVASKTPPPPPAPAAKTAPAPRATPSAASGSVRDVLVKNTANGVEISIVGVTSSNPLLLTGPDRLVLDFHGPAPQKHSIPVNSSDVKGIRIAQYQAEPPVTRVVIDLVGKRQFDIIPMSDRVVVKIESVPGTKAVPPATKPTAHPATAEKHIVPPASKPVTAEKHVTPPASKTASTQSAHTTTPTAQVHPLKTGTVPPPPPPTAASTRPHHTQVAAANPPSQTPLPDYSYVQPRFEKVSPGTQANSAARTISGNEPGGVPGQQPGAGPPAEGTPPPGAPTATASKKYTGEPISVNLKDADLKDFFRLISEISGLNIVIDPSISGKETLVLNDVPWDQALDLVLENHGLDKQLEGNVLRIASVESLKKEADAKALHAQAVAHSVEPQTVTRILSYAHARDLVPIVKKFLTDRGDVIADDRTNSLIVRDIPSVMPVIDRIITQLDRKTQQVEIEARVVAAKRSFMRDLGVQLGFGWGNGSTAVGGAPTGNNSPLTSTLPTTNYLQNAGSIPLFSNNPASAVTSGLSFLNATKNYRIDAILSMAESRGLLKVLSRPRIVTQNNVTATVMQGTQLPIVTSGQLGRAGFGHLHQRFPPAHGDSADHRREHHLSECGCGKYPARPGPGGKRQPRAGHAEGDNAGIGLRRQHGGDWRRGADHQQHQHDADAAAGQHPAVGQPVQSEEREHLNHGAHVLHYPEDRPLLSLSS